MSDRMIIDYLRSLFRFERYVKMTKEQFELILTATQERAVLNYQLAEQKHQLAEQIVKQFRLYDESKPTYIITEFQMHIS